MTCSVTATGRIDGKEVGPATQVITEAQAVEFLARYGWETTSADRGRPVQYDLTYRLHLQPLGGR